MSSKVVFADEAGIERRDSEPPPDVLSGPSKRKFRVAVWLGIVTRCKMHATEASATQRQEIQAQACSRASKQMEKRRSGFEALNRIMHGDDVPYLRLRHH